MEQNQTPSRIVWSEYFSVGVESLDEQHKKLIMMLNRMIDDPSATTRSETVAEILSEMTSYAREHFRTEEELMIQYGYPQSQQHKNLHRAFSKEVEVLKTATDIGVEGVPQVLLGYLGQWLAQHILHDDMQYKQFFAEKSVAV